MKKVALVVVLAASLVLAGSASSTTRPSLRVRPSIALPGARVWATGNAAPCPRGDTVLVISRAFPGQGFAGIGAISAHVGAGGAFAAAGRVRRNAAPGRYGLTARCGGGNLGVIAYLRVR